MVAYLTAATIIAVWVSLVVLLKLDNINDKIDQLEATQEERIDRLARAVQYIMENTPPLGRDKEKPVRKSKKAVYVKPDGALEETNEEFVQDGNVTYLTYKPKEK